MTVPATARKAGPYLGTGLVSLYPFSFKVFSAADIALTQADTFGVEVVLSSGFSVAINSDQKNNPGGSITLTSPLPSGYKLTILGNLPYDQTLTLPGGGAFNPVNIESELDRLLMQIQQLVERRSREILSASTDDLVSQELPSAVPLALIGWDPAGTRLQNYSGAASVAVSSFMATVVAAATAAAARTLLGMDATFADVANLVGVYKLPCRVVTSANIANLATGAPLVVDGVTLVAADRVLVNAQTTGSQNGIYTVTTAGAGADGAWVRAADADATGELNSGALVLAKEGSVFNRDLVWRLATDGVIVPGTTAISFQREVSALATATQVGTQAVRRWVSRVSASDITWTDITWSPSLRLFAAVGESGVGNRVMTSPDGINWTLRATPADDNWRSIAWSPSLGLFAACAELGGASQRVMTSPDGITWTLRTPPALNSWRGIAWSSTLGLFAAVALSGVGNRVMTSPDGITWTVRVSPADNFWNAIVWATGLSLFVAVAEGATGNGVMTSPDGINWTTRAGSNNAAWVSIAWSPELVLLVATANAGGTGNRVMTSPDGINWTTRVPAIVANWAAVRWAPEFGLFISVANETGGTKNVMSSPDGINWTLQTSAPGNFLGLAWSPELMLFAAVSTSGVGNRVMTSA